jgi:DNA-binding XRE family transcriptional regulator
MGITGPQLRAARGMLDWSRAELAKLARVSQETIKNIESGTYRPQEATSENLIRIFASHDVVFTEQEGIKRQKQVSVTLQGKDGFVQFMEDVYLTISQKGGDICVSGVDDRLFLTAYGKENAEKHFTRMNKLKNLKARALIRAGDKVALGKGYMSYKWDKTTSSDSVPFYVYGEKLAIIIFQAEPSPQVVVLTSSLVANAYRRQFDVLWDQATSVQD